MLCDWAQIKVLQERHLNPIYVEEVNFFGLHEFEAYYASKSPQQYCIAVEQPTVTLGRIVDGMPKCHDWRKDEDQLCRYISMVCTVLRVLGKALRYVHQQDVIHGNVSLDTSGKFGENWKLMSITGIKRKGEEFQRTRFGENSPPEAVQFVRDEFDPMNALRETRAVFRPSIVAEPTFDIWSFGKLCYEALTGEALFPFDPTKDAGEDVNTMKILGEWNEERVKVAVSRLLTLGVTAPGADLVSQCLSPKKDDRPQNMDEVLKHPFWYSQAKKTATYK